MMRQSLDAIAVDVFYTCPEFSKKAIAEILGDEAAAVYTKIFKEAKDDGESKDM